MKPNQDEAFELGAVAYIGQSCPVCKRVYETFADLKQTRFGAKLVHHGCWATYCESEVQRLRGIVERAKQQADFGIGCVLAVLDEA